MANVEIVILDIQLDSLVIGGDLREERKKTLVLYRWKGKRKRSIAFVEKKPKTQTTKPHTHKNEALSYFPAPVRVWHWVPWDHKQIPALSSGVQ